MIDMTWLSAMLLGAGCLALGYIIGMRHSSRTFLSNRASGDTETLIDGKKRKGAKQPFEVERLAEILEDFKMVLVVRNDLKMGKGKIAAQCSHATLGLYKKLHNRAPKALNRWEMCGQVKVVVKIESEDDMLVLQFCRNSILVYQKPGEKTKTKLPSLMLRMFSFTLICSFGTASKDLMLGLMLVTKFPSLMLRLPSSTLI